MFLTNGGQSTIFDSLFIFYVTTSVGLGEQVDQGTMVSLVPVPRVDRRKPLTPGIRP